MDVGDLWDRFEIFEALHHDIDVCNPMRRAHLDALLDALELEAGERILDIACGSGALLIEAARRTEISGLGIDLSPWMIRAAVTRHESCVPQADLRWLLADASRQRCDEPVDVATCLGAEWVWHDFSGTVRALADRIHPTGRAVIGAARLHHEADPTDVAQRHGRVETVDDQQHRLARYGFDVVLRVDPDDDAWDAYLDRTKRAAYLWAEQRPGERADRWIGEQASWAEAREHDRGVIGWSAWVLRRAVAVRDDPLAGL